MTTATTDLPLRPFGPTGLQVTSLCVGCAPLGTSLDCERALAAGFDDFMAGRASPRELAARVRSVARRIGQSRNRCRLVAVPSGARHAQGGR